MAGKSRFVVDLGDIKASDALMKKVNQRIQSAVLEELATIDLGGDIGVRFPKEWLGIWIRMAHPTSARTSINSKRMWGGS